MSQYRIFKNALVLTLDENNRTGFFNLVLKDKSVFEVDYDNRLNTDSAISESFPGAEVIDMKGKLILPSFFNSWLNSEYIFGKYFLKNLSFEKITSDISLNLIHKYFSLAKNKTELEEMILCSRVKTLSGGEIFINDSVNCINKDFLSVNPKISNPLNQEVIYTSSDNSILNYFDNNKKFCCITLADDEEINNYSLTHFRRLLQKGNVKIFLDVLNNQKNADNIRNSFGKSLIKVLDECDILSSNIILSNPLYLNKEDFNLALKKKINIVICPTDIFKLSAKKFDLSELVSYGFNISVGTGYLGTNVFSEVKALNSLYYKGIIDCNKLLRFITDNPFRTFEIKKNIGGIIKKNEANFVVFDINGLEKSFDFPELDGDNLSEYILENLDINDIIDVIFQGEYVVKNKSCILINETEISKMSSQLIKKYYEIGKFFELKEKLLMTKRIKDISNKQEEKVRIFESFEEDFIYDMDSSAIQDSEFKVVGIKQYENLSNSQTINELEKDDDNVIEISDFREGLNIFEENLKKEPVSISTDLKKITINLNNKISFDDTKTEQNISDPSDSGKTEFKKEKTAASIIKPVFSKIKLKFGFDDDKKK